jgi:hypothetical protein
MLDMFRVLGYYVMAKHAHGLSRYVIRAWERKARKKEPLVPQGKTQGKKLYWGALSC